MELPEQPLLTSSGLYKKVGDSKVERAGAEVRAHLAMHARLGSPSTLIWAQQWWKSKLHGDAFR